MSVKEKSSIFDDETSQEDTGSKTTDSSESDDSANVSTIFETYAASTPVVKISRHTLYVVLIYLRQSS